MKALVTIFIVGLLAIFGLMEQDRQKRIAGNAELKAENARLVAQVESLEAKLEKSQVKAPEPEPAKEPVKVAAIQHEEPKPEPVEYRPAYTPAPAPEPELVAVDNSALIRELTSQVLAIETKVSEARQNLRDKEREWRAEDLKRGLRSSDAERDELRAKAAQYIAGLESEKSAINERIRGL